MKGKLVMIIGGTLLVLGPIIMIYLHFFTDH